MLTPAHSLDSLGADANALVLRHWDATIRRFLRGDGAIVNDRFAMISTGEPHPLGNFASLSPPCDEADSVREAIDALPEQLPSAIVLPTDTPAPEAQSLLMQRGLALAEEMPTMGIDAASLREAPVDAAYDFVRIDASRAHEWGDAFARGYEIPPKIAMKFAAPALENAPECRYFAGTHAGEIVSTAFIHLEDGLAGIYGISTVPAHRRKGLGAWITAKALCEAATKGYPVGILQASVAGHPVYERLGFRRFGSMLLYVRIPG